LILRAGRIKAYVKSGKFYIDEIHSLLVRRNSY
jgi:hypothetical protein